MKISELQEIFLKQLKSELAGWTFVKRDRSFKKKEGNIRFYFHIACINHVDDFDATGDVAIEFLDGKKQICIIGAQLFNIDGSGQRRFQVSSFDQAKLSAKNLYKYFLDVGMPFLERFKDPFEVLAVLKNGGKDGMLISPIVSSHHKQIKDLESYTQKKSM